MASFPVVAIVGRPNVGKSTLLNALAGRRISIVQDMPGVTRDRIATPLQIDDRYVELVDTGGYGFVDPDHSPTTSAIKSKWRWHRRAWCCSSSIASPG